jgi:hypothetical protein
MTTTDDDDLGPWQPRRDTLKQIGRSARTVERWERDPKLNFPKPVKVKGRKLDQVNKVKRFMRELAAKAGAA